MQNEIIFVVEEDPDGGYIAAAHGSNYGIFTEADTLAELREMVRDAVQVHFEDGERPAIIRLHFVRDEVISA